MNRESYAKNACNLPNGSMEIIIEGGNHAGFGAYGSQKGDGALVLHRNLNGIGLPMPFLHVISEL